MTTEVLKMAIRDGIFLNYSIKETTTDNISNELAIQSNYPVHEDLKKALEDFKPHIGVLMGWSDHLTANDAESLENVFPKSIDFGNMQSVILGFQYFLPNLGIPANISIRKVDFVAHENQYPPMEALEKATKKLYAEVLNYHNGKHGAGAQLTMDLDAAFGDEDKPAPKKRGRKKMEAVKDEEYSEAEH